SNATQTSPPEIRRDSSAVRLKEKLKITTTSRAKNNMELSASFERHSRRRSLCKVLTRTSANPGEERGRTTEPELIRTSRNLQRPAALSSFDRCHGLRVYGLGHSWELS